MDPNRKLWNEQQQGLRLALSQPIGHSRAIQLFLAQHAMVHAADMSQAGLWSFTDEIWQGLEQEESVRRVPRGCEHSIVWLFWHMARIEDVTMNILVAGCPQIFQEDRWQEQLKIEDRTTGNLMDIAAVARLSTAIDISALNAYRFAVGRRTREIVQTLQPEDVRQKVAGERLQKVLDEGAVIEAARDLIAYWGGLTIAGLLLMPPTRHNFIHLNEAIRVKEKAQREEQKWHA